MWNKIITLLQCFFCWRVEVFSRSQMIGKAIVNHGIPDVVIAQSFGLRAGNVKNPKGLPGFSNEVMAKIIKQDFKDLPKILQWEVADALGDRKVKRIEQHREKGEYLDTYEVISQTKEFMLRSGMKRAVLIAHPFHAWRVKKVCEKMGIRVVVPYDIIIVPFDPLSVQWQTRNLKSWIFYEMIARLIYWHRGWI